MLYRSLGCRPRLRLLGEWVPITDLRWFTWSNPHRISSSSIQKSFLLTIDNSNSIPVVLKDVSLSRSLQDLHIENIIPGTPGPPGKLYTSHAATALLETLETGGSCARLVPDETATPDQRLVFDAFCRKLGEGGLVRHLVRSSS